jgi:protein translocase SecG subunit
MKNALIIVQIALAVIMTVSILMQNRGSGLSGVFGGSGGVYRTKRGLEKILHLSTIIFSILFFGVSLAVVLI